MAITFTDGEVDVDSVTVEAIEAEVAEIASKAKDDELAHRLEDDLRDTVLLAIAAGAANAAQLAKAVLKTDDVDFHRWYA